QVPAPESLRNPQPVDPRDVAAVGVDARNHHCDDLRTAAAGRRSDSAVRVGHVVRNLHRYVLVDLHRGAGAALDREALAGRGRARRTHVRRPRTGDAAGRAAADTNVVTVAARAAASTLGGAQHAAPLPG